jgi:lipid A 3-O-deacylase
MRFLATVLFVLTSCGASTAQQTVSQASAETKETWEFGLFAGGGNGLRWSSDKQFAYAGVRVGRIMTKERSHGWRRGNFEWALEAMPLYETFTPLWGVPGGSIKPLILQWNFTSREKIVPYTFLAGGLLFSTSNLPPGQTSRVNFTPEAAFGVNWFVRPRSALRLEMAVVHHSNANLGNYNPGIGASLFFTVGYNWFETRE